MKSVVSQYDRSMSKYMQMKTFEQFIGSSGDISNMLPADKHQIYAKQLLAASKSGKEVGQISARSVEKWYRLGWFKLFDNRCVVLVLSVVECSRPNRWSAACPTTRPPYQ